MAGDGIGTITLTLVAKLKRSVELNLANPIDTIIILWQTESS